MLSASLPRCPQRALEREERERQKALAKRYPMEDLDLLEELVQDARAKGAAGC